MLKVNFPEMSFRIDRDGYGLIVSMEARNQAQSTVLGLHFRACEMMIVNNPI